TIYVDAENKGTTVTPSFTVSNVAVGTRVVVLQLSGYQNFTTSTDVPEGGTTTISATMIPNTLAPTITSITPSSGYNTSAVSITNLAGTGFATTGTPTVVLMNSGQTNITATSVSVVSATQITCSFDITGKAVGSWNVVVTNPDGQSGTFSNGFQITNLGTTASLSSITPNSGVVNTSVLVTDLAGTGFLNTATIRLKRSGYNDILGTGITVVSATKITGTFNLNGQTPGPYDVCVLNDGITPTCGLAFTISSVASTANGTINVKSAPTTSKIFLNSVFKGYTPLTLDNITPGTYTVMIRSAGFNEYSESVRVTAGNTSYVTASLVLTPDETTTTTTAPKTTVSTVKTTAKSTVKVPTPWPSATPTPASSVSALAILGAVGVGLIVLRKP
ncbi:MAG: PEGA domain-containing protein, partial [Methanoregula sp.]|nr:PEGA domain-containing protein [Methanoregula sp.]